MQQRLKLWLFFTFIMLLSGCSEDEKSAPSQKNEYLAGNLSGFNHVKGTNVNWFTVNGTAGEPVDLPAVLCSPQYGIQI